LNIALTLIFIVRNLFLG